MRREFIFALIALLTAAFAAAQQPAPPAPPAAPNAPPEAQTVYYAGPGVTAPSLVPPNFSGHFASHCKTVEGTLVLSAVVAADGTAHDIQYMHQVGNGLDEMALKLVQADRFKPGTHGGAAAPVAILIEVNLAACSEEKKDETGKKNEMLRLQSVPTQAVEVQPLTKSPPPTLSGDVPAHPSSSEPSQALVRSRISAPVVTHSVEAQYPDAARKAKFTGTCLISLIVDTNGQPQNVHVVKSLSPSLDEKAIEAVEQYRFKPALKDGKIPVPIMITVEVDFRLY